MKNKAFTLAEVLITLAIIGVIAAITIPSIIANHQKRTLETQFAKAYRTLSTAVQMAVAEHGEFDSWDFKNDTYTSEEQNALAQKYFLPYLNVVKFCPAGEIGCFPDVMYKRKNGNDFQNISKSPAPRAMLADGTNMVFITEFNYVDKKRRAYEFYIDINGFKKPNTTGYDLFSFLFFPQTGEFLPQNINIEGRFDEETGAFVKRTAEEINADCLSSSNSSGWSCGAKVIQDGFKMNY